MLTLDANIWVAAYDPRDHFHAESAAFLLEAARRALPLNGPAFVLVEAGCALARRARSVAAGQAALERLRLHPLLSLQPLDGALLAAAARLGVQQLLRGADALYAATAEISGAQLVSWDEELIRRAGAISPTDWLAETPGN